MISDASAAPLTSTSTLRTSARWHRHAMRTDRVTICLKRALDVTRRSLEFGKLELVVLTAGDRDDMATQVLHALHLVPGDRPERARIRHAWGLDHVPQQSGDHGSEDEP
jgi:hypothetical protein